MSANLKIKTDDRVARLAQIIAQNSRWRVVRELESLNYGEGFELSFQGLCATLHDSERSDEVYIEERTHGEFGYLRYEEVFSEVVERMRGQVELTIEFDRWDEMPHLLSEAVENAQSLLEKHGYPVRRE